MFRCPKSDSVYMILSKTQYIVMFPWMQCTHTRLSNWCSYDVWIQIWKK